MRYPAVSPQWWKDKWKLRMLDLVDNYHPDFIYLDGAMPFLDDKGKTGFEFAAYYYNDGLKRHGGKQEVVLTYKGSAMRQEKNKGFYVSGIATKDNERHVPDHLIQEPWQTDDSIGPWGYNTTVPYTSVNQLIDKFVDVVSKNGTFLLNVPPRADGTFDDDTVLILKELGEWNRINGEAIFGTRPWKRFGEGPVNRPDSRAKISPFTSRDIRFTQSKDGKVLYVIALDRPEGGILHIGSLSANEPALLKIKSLKMLGCNEELKWTRDEDGLHIVLLDVMSCKYAFSLRIEK
jgi:alpha-L-fucosidase